MVLRSNPVEFLDAKGKDSVSRCFLMWKRARIGSEGSTDIGEHAEQPRRHWPQKVYEKTTITVADSCWWQVAFDHISCLHYDTSIHYGIFELGPACASSQHVMGWKRAGLGAGEVKRGLRLSPGQEEDHR